MNNRISITTIVSIIALIIVSFALINRIIDQQDIICYECVDTLGNTVYCTRVTRVYGTKYGETQDGTNIQIVQYKPIRKEVNYENK